MVVQTREVRDVVSARTGPMSDEEAGPPETPPQPPPLRRPTCAHNPPFSLFHKDIDRHVFMAIVFGLLVGFFAAKCTTSTHYYRSSTPTTMSNSCRRAVDRLVSYVTPPR